MAAREHVQLVHGPGCMCIRHQQERAEAAAKAQPAAPKLTVEPAVVPVERATRVKVVPVTNTRAVTNAARQSRWRSKQDPVALRGQAKERMKGLRARRRAGKVVAS